MPLAPRPPRASTTSPLTPYASKRGSLGASSDALTPSLICCLLLQLMDELLCGRLCVATMALGMSKVAMAIAVR